MKISLLCGLLSVLVCWSHCSLATEVTTAPEPEEVDVCKDFGCAEGSTCKAITLTGTKKAVAVCIDPLIAERCQLPIDVGPCKAAKPRFHYDVAEGGCKTFLFGGCEGNENNFADELTCGTTCPTGEGTDSSGDADGAIAEVEPIDETGESDSEESSSEEEEEGEGESAKEECSKIMCTMYCAHGFKKDDKGCNICECSLPKEGCPEVHCVQTCVTGFKKDENGCQICECDEPPINPSPECPGSGCQIRCDNGFQFGENGCPICKCKEDPKECGDLYCFIYCPHGKKKKVPTATLR